MANSYAEPSRLRRIMKNTPPPRQRPSSSIAGSISVNGGELGNRRSTGFDAEDHISEDPGMEDAGGLEGLKPPAQLSPSKPQQPQEQQLRHQQRQIHQHHSQPMLHAKKSAWRHSEDLSQLNRHDSLLFGDSQTDLSLPPAKENSHMSLSQMLLNGTRHVSLLRKKSSMRRNENPTLGRHHSMTRAGNSGRNSRAPSRIRSRSMESIRSLDSLAQRRLDDNVLTFKPTSEEPRHEAQSGSDTTNSAFYVPVPTNGNPTEVLALRFQAWRKILKDIIGYFREIQRSYEMRSKLMISASSVVNNIVLPPTFLVSGGLGDATTVLRDYHRLALIEANKAKEIEAEIIVQLTGLRTDLQHKLKEIKGLSGDFKNNVDKEMESTKKAVRQLQEALSYVDSDPSAITGKGDPFIVRMSVDRQVKRQIEEENYLHMAFLNLESSGRDLESIVVGEIQKAYDSYANILKRDAELALETANRLQNGPISLPKDYEWNAFVLSNENLVDPDLPVREVVNITYPGKNHPATKEIRSGILERKSKYLKSYTPGWYVLSPTHLHEFRSADKIMLQAPVMSLYLPEQKLGSHSNEDSTSHKFMLKGRQTGSMHRGHAWVFRSEGHDQMLAWYEDIKNLTEKTGEERDKYVKRHARHLSSDAGLLKAGDLASIGGSRLSMGSESAVREPSPESEFDEDEADKTPYSRRSVVLNPAKVKSHFHTQSVPHSPQGRPSTSSTSSLSAARGQLAQRSAQTSPHLRALPTSHPGFNAPQSANEPQGNRGKFTGDVSALRSDIDTAQLGTSISSSDSVPICGRDREVTTYDNLAVPGPDESPDKPTGRNSFDASSFATDRPSHSSLSICRGPPTPSTVGGPSYPDSLNAPIHESEVPIDQPPEGKQSQVQDRSSHSDGVGTYTQTSGIISKTGSVMRASLVVDNLLQADTPPPRPLKYHAIFSASSIEGDGKRPSPTSLNNAVPKPGSSINLSLAPGGSSTSIFPNRIPASGATGTTVSTAPGEDMTLSSICNALSSRTSYDSSTSCPCDGAMSPLALAEREPVSIKEAIPVEMRQKTAEVIDIDAVLSQDSRAKNKPPPLTKIRKTDSLMEWNRLPSLYAWSFFRCVREPKKLGKERDPAHTCIHGAK
ncbi:hypothetical protein KEM54_001264 [Ascosphaera aggregata]|nr:hypothetical protein KEM54_001264 [Ascosphaera aggregata]